MINILPKDGDVFYNPNLFSLEESKQFFRSLKEEIKWRHEPIVLFGKKIMQPRLTAWYGDDNKVIRYSGIKMQPLPWTPVLIEIKTKVESFSGVAFNSVLLNQYRNESDSMGWHRDNEKELGTDPVIASVSFGATRTFHFRHVDDPKLKKIIPLNDGSCLIMRGSTQHFWYHRLPKLTKPINPRINLTFRIIK
jgi:hypothetical protein